MEEKSDIQISIEQLSQEHKLGLFQLKNVNRPPQRAERVEDLRQDFSLGIRAAFLRYLPQVDPQAFFRLFNQEQRNLIEMGFQPTGWNIHHQQPLQWGGRNFNPAFAAEISQIKLTKEQEKKCQKDKGTYHARKQALQLSIYLKKAQENNHLKKTFLDLFNGYLILLPEETHNALENQYLQPQAIPMQRDEAKKRENGTNEVNTYSIFYPVWKQVILGGRTFEKQNSRSGRSQNQPQAQTPTKPKTVSQKRNNAIEYRKKQKRRSRSDY